MTIIIERHKPFENYLPTDSISKIIGGKTGIINSLNEVGIERDDSEVYLYSTGELHFEKMPGMIKINPKGGGAGFSIQSAMMSTICEAIERYSTCYFEEEMIIRASYNELIKENINVINPNIHHPFSESQYNTPGFLYDKFDPQKPLSWIEGISLRDGQPIHFPASLIVGPHIRKNELRYGYATTSGCAVATTLEEAIEKGICELIERDAVMTSWYARLSLPKLEIKSCEWLDKLYNQRISKKNKDFYIIYATLDIDVPVFFCITVDNTDRNIKMLMSAAASLDPKTAIIKSIVGNAQCVSYQKCKTISTPYSNINSEKIFDFGTNTVFYGRPENFKHVSFLTSSKNTVEFDGIIDKSTKSPRKNLNKLINILSKKDLTPIAFDFTTEDVREMGLHAVRVVIPEIVPLGLPSIPFLGSKRLYQVPQELNYVSEILQEDELNRMPHPFP